MPDEFDGKWPGLSASEATSRLAAEGFNELPRSDRRTLPRIVLDVVREPMFALLLAGGGLYLVLGDLQEVMTNIGLILVNRTYSASVLSAFKGNTVLLWGVVGVAIGLLLLSVTWPPAERLFHFGPLHFDDLAITLAGGLLVLVLLDWLKPLFRTRLLS